MIDDIFQAVNQVNWPALEVAGGTAAHIPSALKGLLDSDATTRKQCYWQLDNEVVCQSTLYGAAYDIVSFLIAILRVRPEYGREEIYELLYEIANGSALSSKTCVTKDGIRLPLQEGCFAEVYRGMEVYSSDTKSDNVTVRKKAEALLKLIRRKMQSE